MDSDVIQVGRVASLHLHPAEPGTPLVDVASVEAVAGKGLERDLRYFARISSRTGRQTERQVSLIAREQVADHASALGLESITPGRVRSNIETTGVDLIPLLGREVEVGGARLRFNAPREPCAKMDAICKGLRERMLDRRQGVLAEVTRSGTISVGDAIRICSEG